MNTIATLYEMKRRLGLAPTDTTEDERLLTALTAATAQLERMASRHFTPYVATLRHDVLPIVPGELLLNDDLLELTALADDAGAIDVSTVLLLPEGYPKSSLKLTVGVAFHWESTRYRAVAVTGTWGYHPSPSAMWQTTGDTLQADLSAGASTFSSADADAARPDGSPWYQVGGLLRVGEEFMRVVEINTSTDTVTVMREVNGTAATAHSTGAAVGVYAPPADIAMVALRWAIWLYKEADGRVGQVGPTRDLIDMLGRLRRSSVLA